MGAWIEIDMKANAIAEYESLLSWERGLKSCRLFAYRLSSAVAPLVGAWIEIEEGFINDKYLLSLLSWERGLKYLPLRTE